MKLLFCCQAKENQRDRDTEKRSIDGRGISGKRLSMLKFLSFLCQRLRKEHLTHVKYILIRRKNVRHH